MVVRKYERDDEEVAQLKESIQTVGLLQPIIAFQKDDETYDIVDGYKRYAAACLLGWSEIQTCLALSEELLTC